MSDAPGGRLATPDAPIVDALGFDNPGPEHQAKRDVSQWLESHGATVWWEETNKWGYDTFSIHYDDGRTELSRPDLVVELGDITLVAEFKTGDSKGDVYDALPSYTSTGFGMSAGVRRTSSRTGRSPPTRS
ncbi:hypothetical protein [Halalkalicoccus salilacus]|uniref:hypothetical protein n=1 Tax=Halalkalicoccus sp. GCM10025704 TaxID=3252662 RepID=UPI00362236C5